MAGVWHPGDAAHSRANDAFGLEVNRDGGKADHEDRARDKFKRAIA